jgi:hypothetical protein
VGLVSSWSRLPTNKEAPYFEISKYMSATGPAWIRNPERRSGDDILSMVTLLLFAESFFHEATGKERDERLHARVPIHFVVFLIEDRFDFFMCFVEVLCQFGNEQFTLTF